MFVCMYEYGKINKGVDKKIVYLLNNWILYWLVKKETRLYYDLKIQMNFCTKYSTKIKGEHFTYLGI